MKIKFSNSKRFLIFLLGLLSAIGPFSIDMYLPGFTYIAEDLGTSIDRVQLSLTSFFIGIAFGQLIYGPIMDRFGRKKPLMIGLFIYILSSVLCAVAINVEALIALRFTQALRSCAGMVAAREMVRDFFKPYETANVMSLLMLVIGISPIIAPTLGSLMIQLGDWHYIFYVLAGIGITIALLVHFFLKGAKGADQTISLRPKYVMEQYQQVISLKQFIIFALAGGFAASGMYAYLSGSPFVLMELYAFTEAQYGWAFAMLASGLIIAAQLNSLVLRYYDSLTIARWASFSQLIVGLSLVIVGVMDIQNVYLLLGLLFRYLFFQGFVFPNTSAMSLNPFKRLAGSASALMGFLQLFIGAITSMVVSVFHNGTQAPMGITMGVVTALGFIILWSYRPKVLLEDVY